MSIIEAFSSVLTGGLTGVLGSSISKVFEYKEKKMELDKELKLRELDLKIMAEEWAQRTKIASVEAEAKVETADAEAFSKSFAEPEHYSRGLAVSAAQTWLLVVLDFIRGVARPGITIFLCALATYLYWDAHSLIKTTTDGDAIQLTNKIVNTILYLWSASTLWWFGARPRKKE